jgi:hypothetical protein
MAFCKQCGTQLNEGAKFCRKCGTSATPAPQAQNQYQQPQVVYVQPQAQPYRAQPAAAPKKKKKTLLVVLVVAVLVIILFRMIDGSDTQSSSGTGARPNYGRLPNTTWTSTGGDLLGGIYSQTLDFGNGTYSFNLQYYLFGLPINVSETGAYTVSGDSITFTSNDDTTSIGTVNGSSDDGKQIRGTIVGNSLTVGGSTYR